MGGQTDAFVSKFSLSGNMLFSTYLGGNDYDAGQAIAVDSKENVYITGYSFNNNFPVKNAFQSNFRGEVDAIVAKFNSTGSLMFSTYFGGSNDDRGTGIAVDSAGNIYITGTTYSNDFPTKNAYNATFGGETDVFVAKFNSTGSLLFSTYLGGSNYDFSSAIAVDSSGNSFITGSTSSNNFPTKNAYNATYGGNGDAFFSEFNTNGSLVSSSYIGGSYIDSGYGIAIDNNGNRIIGGATNSPDFPTKNAFISITTKSEGRPFLMKFNKTGGLVFSTYFGEFGFGTFINDPLIAVAADSTGNIFITGSTSANTFPTKFASQTINDGGDAFIAKFNATGQLIYSTLWGGKSNPVSWAVAVDKDGNSYVTGFTGSGSNDVFIVKFPANVQLVIEPSLFTRLTWELVVIVVMVAIIIVYKKYFIK